MISKLVDDTYSKLLAVFPSLSDFDDIYSYDACIDTHLCSVCVEIEVALQANVFPINEVIDEVFFPQPNRPLNNHHL